MTALLLTPVVLSGLVLAAHFLRDGRLFGVAIVLILLTLVAVPRRWAARLLQIVLFLGAVEWVRTLFELRAMRAALGMPAARMTVILAGVAAFTALSALLFETPPLRRRFADEPAGEDGEPAGGGAVTGDDLDGR